VRSIEPKLAGGRRRAQRRSPEDATARIGSVLPIPAVLRSLGPDSAEVLAEVGLDLDLFDDPENRISYAAHSRLDDVEPFRRFFRAPLRFDAEDGRRRDLPGSMA